MGTVVSFNGTNYTVPATGERAWGGQVSAYLIAIASGSLQKTGGSFTLTAADIDFGATYGLKASKFASRTTPSTTGIFRLGNNESVAWRNAANTADLALKVNASNVLEYAGNPLLTLALGAANTALRMNAGGTAYEWAALTNANIDAAAAIAYSKLNLSLSIVNADISTSAAIVDTKLNTISTAGKVSNSATTATAANTASAIVARDASGNFVAGTITAALTGNASGTAANITGIAAIANGGTGQATKAAGYDALSPMTTAGDTVYGGTAGTGTRLAIGTAGQVLTVNAGATAPSWADAGGGAGEINVNTNPSAASGVTGVTNGTSHTAARVTGANSPLNTVVATAFSFTATTTAVESATSGNYFTFTMPAGLRNRKLAIKAYYTTEASQTWAVSIRNTTGRRSLDTDSSSVTTLPAGTTGQYVGSFDTDTDTGNYTLHFTRTAGSGTAVLYVTLVIVGPGIIAPVPAIGPWESYTPTGSWSTNTTYTGRKRRVGDSAEYQVSISLAGAPTSANLTINQPSGETIDTTKIVNTSRGRLGSLVVYDNAAGGAARLLGEAAYNSSTTVSCYVMDDASGSTHYEVVINATTPKTFANLDVIVINYSAPIAEFAGAPNYAGSNDVEYVYNTDTSTSNDTTSFAYGPTGVAIGSFTSNTTGDTAKRVRFSTPIQVTDQVGIQVSRDSGVTWSDSELNLPRSNANTSAYGILYTTVNTTDIDVKFGKAGATAAAVASYGGNNGDPWSGYTTFKWRAFKARAGGVAVGFGAATNSAMGLVSRQYEGTFTASLTGCTTVPTVTAKYAVVGKIVTVTIPANTATSNTTAATITGMPAAIYPLTNQVTFYGRGINNSTSAVVNFEISTAGVITFYSTIASAVFTASGLKGHGELSFSYTLT